MYKKSSLVLLGISLLITLSLLGLIGCNRVKMPQDIEYPPQWPLPSLTVPNYSSPAPSSFFSNGKHSGKMTSPYEDSYSIGFSNTQSWNTNVDHIKECLKDNSMRIIEDNAELYAFLCSVDNGDKYVILSYSCKDDSYTLSIVHESWVTFE